MQKLLVEIKARCTDLAAARAYLLHANADARGTDHQIDTYYKVPSGRLKLREGNIENSLIFYQRNNQPGPKDSHVSLCKFQEMPGELNAVLQSALGTMQVVDKQREIYFIDNVKFHLDQVARLGTFLEIEAIGEPGVDRQEDLLAQCQHYLKELNVNATDLISNSYSDLLNDLDA